jgi:hypothetical protein
VTDAPTASLDHERLLTYVWRTFERILRASSDNVGLYPQRSIDAVSNSYGDFIRARNRVITITVNGFHDMGALLPDQTWSAQFQVRLQEADFHTPPPEDAALEAPGQDLFANHVNNIVHAEGLIGALPLARKISDSIVGAMPIRVAAPTDPRKPTFPRDVGFIGAVVGPDGSVTLLFSDTPAGRVAALIAQRTIDALLD